MTPQQPASPTNSSSPSTTSPNPQYPAPAEPAPISISSSTSSTSLPPPVLEQPTAPFFRPVPNLEADHAYLEAAEQELLEDIQLFQKQLTESRQRQALRKNRGLLRRNPSVSENILSLAATPRRSKEIRPERPLRQRIISVSLRLPTLRDRQTVRQQHFDAGLPPKAIFSLQAASDFPFVSVGATPVGTDPDSEAFEDIYGVDHRASWHSVNPRQRSANGGGEARYIPVSLPDEPLLLERYHIFCEDILWRLLHYDYASVGSGSDLEDYWNAYRIVNQRFAEAVSEIYEDGDLIWVHDYHLMLLPSLLRESLWYAKIGFFLYTPFPSAELFRILPHRTEILKGVIGADLIGFHSYDYSKQFVASCSRLLGIDGTPNFVEADPRIGRRCELGIYPAGIDVRALRNHVSSKTVKSRVAELRARFEGLKIVVGVDRLDDSFGGIPLKLLAYEQLLTDNPELVGKVVLIQVAMIPRHSRNVASYRAQQMQVNEFVGRINSAFGTLAFSPVHYINSELDPVELHALMSVGHVCVVSTVRDGMGLIPHEWTVCQHASYKGPIVLSEFAGAAHSFATALHVNPWNVDEVAAKIKVALDMGEASRTMRNDAAYQFVTSHTAKLWGFNFLEDLEQCERPSTNSGISGTPPLDTATVIHAYLGTSALPSPASSSTVLSSMNTTYAHPARSPHVQSEQLSNVMLKAFGPSTLMSSLSPEQKNSRLGDYSSQDGAPKNALPSPSNKHEGSWVSPEVSTPLYLRPNRARLFVLDLDGTLVPFQAIAELGAPSQEVLDVIQTLADADPLNFVLIVSSRDRNTVMQWLGGLDVYLAAEDGAFFRTPRATSWTSLFRDALQHEYLHPSNPSSTSLQNQDTLASSVSPEDELTSHMTSSRTPADEVVDASEEVTRTLRSLQENGDVRKDRPSSKLSRDERLKPTSNSFASLSSLESAQNGETEVQKWKNLVLPVMQHFAERTPGVVLEEGDATLTWHYVDSDTDFGRWQARDLHKHVESFLQQGLFIDLLAEEGRRRWIKVRPKKVDKAVAISQTVEHVLSQESVRTITSRDDDRRGTPNIDFILCIGDDRADECMFDLVRDEDRLEALGIHCAPNRIFTCRVGMSPTSATSFIESPARVIELLEDLSIRHIPHLS